MEEADLIAASQRGEVTAFNQLVIHYQQLVYNLAYRMVSDPDLAADITQDSFLSAFNSIKSFRGGSFKAWLLRIASNECFDHFRKKKRRPTASLDSMLEEPGADGMFADHQAGPEQQALSRELLAHIKDSLLRLPEEQRLAVILSDIESLSYEEIAEVTSTSIGTVKSRLSRGRAHLRQILMIQRELLPSRLRHSNKDPNKGLEYKSLTSPDL